MIRGQSDSVQLSDATSFLATVGLRRRPTVRRPSDYAVTQLALTETFNASSFVLPSIVIVIVNSRLSTAPTKAKSRKPAYSQALIQNKVDRQRVRSRE